MKDDTAQIKTAGLKHLRLKSRLKKVRSTVFMKDKGTLEGSPFFVGHHHFFLIS